MLSKLSKSNSQFATIVCIAAMTLAACTHRPTEKVTSRLKWGQHENSRFANILNLKPNESLSVCAPSPDWVDAAHSAVKQWASVIGRTEFIKIMQCGETTDLVINMEGFGDTGLNYFTESPGKIFLNSQSSGDFLKAVALHEYGHSFGLCDQYTDVDTAGCSNVRSPDQNSEEVMGFTSEDKLTLTPGDINGLKAIADDMSIESNQIWKDFLELNSRKTPSKNLIFGTLIDESGSKTPKIAVSIPEGHSLVLCSDAFNIDTCEASNSNLIQMIKVSTKNGRDLYLSSRPLSVLESSSTATFVASVMQTGQSSASQKFVVSRK